MVCSLQHDVVRKDKRSTVPRDTSHVKEYLGRLVSAVQLLLSVPGMKISSSSKLPSITLRPCIGRIAPCNYIRSFTSPAGDGPHFLEAGVLLRACPSSLNKSESSRKPPNAGDENGGGGSTWSRLPPQGRNNDLPTLAFASERFVIALCPPSCC